MCVTLSKYSFPPGGHLVITVKKWLSPGSLVGAIIWHRYFSVGLVAIRRVEPALLNMMPE